MRTLFISIIANMNRSVGSLLTNLYFVRHAHSTYTPDEAGRPLSDRGFTDANTVTNLLKKENIDIVFSSPYRRAIQTVEGMAKYLNKEIVLVDDFKERLLAENPVKDFTAAITKVWKDDNFSWEGGESNKTAQKRGVYATLQVLENYPGKNVVIGTHGNIMVLIMNHFDRKYGFGFWKELEMPDIYKLSFDGKKLVHVKRIWE
ncbi:2,3-bisphosphoglycerate-dependent phosphoglycerate mutase [Cytobacillus eiseniae]|uniref:2,3-bisphosphoglycerate-dependent phosphoglycerate mutase n=1 Tax=Cytobacillus eiseniae TaxID=762947 RepID=A0ABS4RKG0_9BACI|nr:histidine phosphatase family protein [Cytobacillus eiseniae]MBP2242835.1 2,3-bisphosphoglycerate-dependent phosphoglycerate mutase [Cytobacillus eiseniae]